MTGTCLQVVPMCCTPSDAWQLQSQLSNIGVAGGFRWLGWVVGWLAWFVTQRVMTLIGS